MFPLTLRYKAVLHYMYFRKSLRAVARIYSVGKSTLQRWVVSEYCMFGKHAIASAKRRRKSKFMPSLNEYVKAEIASQPFLTVRQLQQRYKSLTDTCPCKTSLYRALHAAGLSYKQAFRQVQRTHEASAVFDFCERFDSAFKAGTLIALDEMGVHLGMRPRRGWANVGQRLVASSRTMRYAKLSVIMAVSCNAVVGNFVSSTNINKFQFLQFIQGLDVPRGSTILMDNIAFHRSREVVDLMTARGFQALYTLPYSPAANPIENLFSVIKRDLRQICDGSEDVATVSNHILTASLRAQRHCTACFKKVHRMTRDCIDTNDPSRFRQYDGAACA